MESDDDQVRRHKFYRATRLVDMRSARRRNPDRMSSSRDIIEELAKRDALRARELYWDEREPLDFIARKIDRPEEWCRAVVLYQIHATDWP